MKHSEKVILKHASYSSAGFDCTPAVVEATRSFFLSLNEGVYRKHVFTDQEITVELSTEQEFNKNKVNIPEPPVQGVIPAEVVLEKVTKKVEEAIIPKKKTRKKKNA